MYLHLLVRTYELGWIKVFAAHWPRSQFAVELCLLIFFTLEINEKGWDFRGWKNSKKYIKYLFLTIQKLYKNNIYFQFVFQ